MQSSNAVNKVTDIATRRVARTAPVSQVCKYHEALESVTVSNIKFMMAWQRTLLRAMTGS